MRQMLEGGVLEMRNQISASMFHNIGYAWRFGSGGAGMIKDWERTGLGRCGLTRGSTFPGRSPR